MGRLLVKNDGLAFREEDWQRLKRIAEGNPDEQKIGGLFFFPHPPEFLCRPGRRGGGGMEGGGQRAGPGGKAFANLTDCQFSFWCGFL